MNLLVEIVLEFASRVAEVIAELLRVEIVFVAHKTLL
jgi:hypothetical protein